MFQRTEKMVFNFDVQIKFFFSSSESIKLKFLAVPARNANEEKTINREKKYI